MKDQPNIFFVVLPAIKEGQTIAVNIADIIFVSPDGDGSIINLRDCDDGVLCSEPPDRVAARIDAAVRSSLTGFAKSVMDLARALA